MVSVIIPTYNRKATIVKAIESVLEQTYSDIECIVVDDCSTDGTYEVVEKIDDRRLKYFKLSENMGACYARNFGIEHSCGEFIAFNDSDDTWHKDKIEKQLDFMERQKMDASFCCLRLVDGYRVTIFPNQFKGERDLCIERLLTRNFASTQTIMCQRKCIEKCKFDEQLVRYQDWDFMIQLMQEYKVGFLNEPLVDVFIGNDNISIDPLKGYRACVYLSFKYMNMYSNYPKAFSRMKTLIGTFLYQIGEKHSAEEMFIASISLDKKNYLAWIKLILSKIGILKYRYPYVDWKKNCGKSIHMETDV